MLSNAGDTSASFQHLMMDAAANGLDGSPSLQPQQQQPLSEAVKSLLDRTGYPLRQENGQRRYGPPVDWTGPIPGRGCEVFVGKLPRDCYEDELVPLFERFGPIYEMRLMMDFGGTNRGYCFVTYSLKNGPVLPGCDVIRMIRQPITPVRLIIASSTSPHNSSFLEALNMLNEEYVSRSDAARAVRSADGHEIRAGRQLGVCLSVDNNRLFVGGLPRQRQRDEILAEISKLADGVRDVIVYPDVRDKTRNRGFAFVEFDSHRDAAMARRKLIGSGAQLWGHTLAVDWAEPEPEMDDDVMSKVKILYVRNLMLSTTEETLDKLFSQAVDNNNNNNNNQQQQQQPAIERVKKIRDYAFIHFRERVDALRAMELLNGSVIDGSKIEVVLAKPADKARQRFTRGKAGDVTAAKLPQIPGITILTNVGGSLVPTQVTSVPASNYVLLTRDAGRSQTQAIRSRATVGGTMTSRGAAGAGRSYSPYKKPMESRLFNYFMPTVELVYPNSQVVLQQAAAAAAPMQTQLPKSPVQLLEELCAMNGLGQPIFQIYSCAHEGVALFACKVIVAGTQHATNFLFVSIEEAQSHAALSALKSLTEGPDNSGSMSAMLSQSMALGATSTIPAGLQSALYPGCPQLGIPSQQQQQQQMSQLQSYFDLQSAAAAAASGNYASVPSSLPLLLSSPPISSTQLPAGFIPAYGYGI